MKKNNIIIKEKDELDVKKLIRPDDMMVSGGDIAFAGSAMHEKYGIRPASIVSLAHLVNRIVLSDRLVFILSEGKEEAPTSIVLPKIIQHCNTIEISQDHPLISDAISNTLANPLDTFDESVVSEMDDHVKLHAGFKSRAVTSAYLSEYAASCVMETPFAPNPFISKPIALHHLRSRSRSLPGRSSAQTLIQYIEDLRKETSKEMNLLRGLDIYDLQVPAIFSAVLRESKSPEDIIPVAAQMNAEAKAFRAWCRSLEDSASDDPKKYLDRVQQAKSALSSLGKSLSVQDMERMQVTMSMPGLETQAPSPTLKKLVDKLNVDLRFYRPRAFLLQLLYSSSKVIRLDAEISRVFKIQVDAAKIITDELIKLSGKLNGTK